MSTVASVLNRERPWPGLASYREGDADFFRGREAEAVELHRLIRAEPLAVLFGISGLGKTSLLEAGVFPRLRADGALPVRVRLHFAPDAPPLAAQLLAAVEKAARDAAILPPQWRADDSLWAAFHRRGQLFWGAEGEPILPVLVLDQFEEIFTLGAADAASRGRVEAFLRELSALVENRAPAPPDAAFSAEPVPLRVVLSLREDYLAALEDLRAHFPGVRRARLRLQPFTAVQARAVVERPGAHLLAPGAVEAILETFVPPGVDPERAHCDPALLSLFCWQLNEARLAASAPQLAPGTVQGSRERILRDFYDTAFAGVENAPAVRRFIEEQLVDAGGYRSSRSRPDALAQPGVTAAAIEQLVRARVLHSVDRPGAPSHVELTHDRLRDVVAASREARRADEAQSAAEDHARTEAQAAAELRRRLRRARLAVGFIVVLLVAAVAALALAWQAREQAVRSEAVALAARAEAEKQAQLAHEQKAEAERQAARAQAEQQTALAAKAEADRQKTAAETQRAEADKQRTAAETQRGEAVASRTAADELIRYMQDDLHDRLTKFGRLDLMESVDARVRQYREKFPAAFGDAPAQHRENSALQNEGLMLTARGDLQGARAAYERFLASADAVRAAFPDDLDARRDVASAHIFIGEVEVQQSAFDAAQEHFETGLKLRREIAENFPDDRKAQRDVASAGQRLAVLLRLRGDLPGALTGLDETVRLLAAVTQQEPGNLDWLADLAVAHRNRGDLLLAQKKSDAALAAYRESLRIAGQSADQDRFNAELAWAAANARQRIGIVHEERNEFAGALEAYRDYAQRAQALVEREPANAQWRFNFASAKRSVGGVLATQGKRDEARTLIGEALAIIDQLAASEPASIIYATERAAVRRELARTYDPATAKAEVRKLLSAALDIFQQLDAAGRLPAGHQHFIREYEDDLRRFGGPLPKAKAAP